jgi:hypothetical protein
VTGIGPGADFTRVIQERVGACSALLAIIGKQWLTIVDDSSHRRIFLEDDYVRHEIGTALKRNIAVIPVLVRDAKMPSAASLPPDLAPLAVRNAIEISDTDFDHDVGILIQALELEFGERRPVTVPPVKSSNSTCLIISVIAALLGVAGVVLLVMMAWLIPRPTPNNNLSPAPAVSPTQDSSPDVESDEIDFDAVGSWTVEAEGAPTRRFDFQEDHTYQANNEQGRWEYSPNNRTLKLQGQFYDANTDTTRPIAAQIVIVRRNGNQFIGHVSSEGHENTVRLTPL